MLAGHSQCKLGLPSAVTGDITKLKLNKEMLWQSGLTGRGLRS